MRVGIGVLVLLTAACGASASTQIQDTIYDESQQPANGTCTIAWLSYTTAAGKFVPAGQTNYTVVNGVVNLSLAPHVYTVTCTFLSRPEIWVVPASSTPVTLALIRHTVPSPPTSWLHAETHRHGGGDEVATSQPTAHGIPKAGSSGMLADGWLGFTPPGTGAVPRSVQSRLSDTVSVKDFGAVGDGTTDDTLAFQRARDYLQSLAVALNDGTYWQGRMPTLYIPAGRYLITSPGVLCPTVSLLRGWRVEGANVGTQLRLNFDDQPDNFLCSDVDKFSVGEFANLQVYGVNGWERGFLFSGSDSGSQPSLMSFRNVRLQNLTEAITMSGSNWMTDRNLLDHVVIEVPNRSGAVGYWVKNNNNSVVHTFLNVEVVALHNATTAVRFESGGILNWFGGSLIVDGTAVGLAIDDDPAVPPNLIDSLNSTYNVYGVKPEVRSANARLYTMNARAILNFYGVHAVTGYTTGGPQGVINKNGRVVFHGGRNWYTHELITDSTSSPPAEWYKPTLIFRDVGIRGRFADQVVITHTGTRGASKGRAECVGCFPSESTFGSAFDTHADDCINCTRGYDGLAWQTRVSLLRRGTFDGEGLPSSSDTGTTFTLPVGSILKRITVVKLSGGSATSGAVVTVTSASGRVLLESPPWSHATAAVITAPDIDYYASASDRTFTVTSNSSVRLYGYVVFEYY